MYLERLVYLDVSLVNRKMRTDYFALLRQYSICMHNTLDDEGISIHADYRLADQLYWLSSRHVTVSIVQIDSSVSPYHIFRSNPKACDDLVNLKLFHVCPGDGSYDGSYQKQ